MFGFSCTTASTCPLGGWYSIFTKYVVVFFLGTLIGAYIAKILWGPMPQHPQTCPMTSPPISSPDAHATPVIETITNPSDASHLETPTTPATTTMTTDPMIVEGESADQIVDDDDNVDDEVTTVIAPSSDESITAA